MYSMSVLYVVYVGILRIICVYFCVIAIYVRTKTSPPLTPSIGLPGDHDVKVTFVRSRSCASHMLRNSNIQQNKIIPTVRYYLLVHWMVARGGAIEHDAEERVVTRK